ncbi:MAG TPA: metallophosphoesterase [Polyangiaceae bacterium]|nr:metallophosphoesterase [Polyangiaceae bacterium]
MTPAARESPLEAARIVHLSDLHIADTRRSRQILGFLPAAVGSYLRIAGAPPRCILVTGDVFDTSALDRTEAMDRFVRFYLSLMSALDTPVPLVLLPGNHDRRKMGVIGPHDPTLFDALAAAAASVQSAPIFVGGRAMRLAELVPRAVHRTGLHVATYDSTVLRTGLFSAGGEVRQDDLLWLLASVIGSGGDAPLLLLMHHHLIPTPLTDVGRVRIRARDWLSRWLIDSVLPKVVSNADREELTMTALGAGTALSTLHGVERPVVVLHGHKHYPTARLVVGTEPGENDVLIVSAGSAGMAEAWSRTDGREVGHLWPSFNVIDVTPDHAIVAQTVAFSRNDGRLAPARTLVDVERVGHRWQVWSRATSTPDRVLLASNEAHVTLLAGDERWTLECRRVLEPVASGAHAEYAEVVQAAPGSRVQRVVQADGEREVERVPFRLLVSTRAASFYRIADALCRTPDAARRAHGRGTTFESVDLVNRVPCARAVLRVTGLPREADAFASVTDMTTGRERVASLARDGAAFELARAPCAARTLLRIYVAL